MKRSALFLLAARLSRLVIAGLALALVTAVFGRTGLAVFALAALFGVAVLTLAILGVAAGDRARVLVVAVFLRDDDADSGLARGLRSALVAILPAPGRHPRRTPTQNAATRPSMATRPRKQPRPQQNIYNRILYK